MRPATVPEIERFGLLGHCFLGRQSAWALLQDRLGRVRRRFTADIEGRIEGGKLILEEEFLFDDGELSYRTWRISATSPGRFEGEADDIIGKARGAEMPWGLSWNYSMALPICGRSIAFDFRDRMYPQAGGAIINRVEIRKLGFRVGDLTLFFLRQEHAGRFRANNVIGSSASAAE
jgi:hypothetical protein